MMHELRKAFVKFAGKTHLERLIQWSHSDHLDLVPGNPKRLHRLWMSCLLPTRQFGFDAWAAFQMYTTPAEAELGSFSAWLHT